VGRTKRRYSAKFKAQVVLEALSGEKSPGQIAKAYGIHHNSVQLWTKKFVERAPEVFSQETTVQEYEHRVRDLEQLLGIVNLMWPGRSRGGDRSELLRQP
jgi:transposase-like protein